MTDESTIEAELRAMVERIELGMKRSSKVGCLAWIVGVPASVVACLGFGVGALATIAIAVAVAVGGVVAFGVFAVSYDDAVAGRVAREFQARFPAGSDERRVALAVLGELRSTGRALEKLRALVQPRETVTRVRSVAPEAVVQAALEPPAPPRDPKAPKVIPLEPFSPDKKP